MIKIRQITLTSLLLILPFSQGYAQSHGQFVSDASISALVQKQQIDNQNPYMMIKQVAQHTFDRFHRDSEKIAVNKEYLKIIVEQELMPYVDYRYAALKVMGRYVRQATPAQRQQFVNAFEGYLVTTYAQAFTAYTDQHIEFLPEADFQDKKQVLVNINIIDKSRPNIKIGFKVRQLKNGNWKAFDLIAEGVSLLRSKESEIGTLIRQQGIDAVIASLAKKANSKIQDNGK